MKVIVQIIKFIFYCIITVLEYALKMLLEITIQLKKPFQ
jgi:hypothetical protein